MGASNLAVLKRLLPLALLLVVAQLSMYAQSEPQSVNPILGEVIQSPDVSLFQLRQYLLSRIAKPPTAITAQQWTAETKRLREHLLRDVVFHGWPQAWVTAPPKFEDLGSLPSGKGYRIRKFRYEVVPGFLSTALLYEPEVLQGKVPAILQVNGHETRWGKAVEYKQKRCINFAKRGVISLNLEWLGMGELNIKGNEHWYGGHMDLVGTHELGLFFLAMRKGLDYLYDYPHVDRSRLGVTGLSGGGWQTIVLSALDERVRVAMPVAGFSSMAPRIEARWYGDIGDVEQSATDFLDGQDYPHLTAMMAPRPTLLAHNAEDDCCFRAPLVKQLNFDIIKPFFKLYGKEDVFEWHENTDPGTHNYQLDNRQQAYRFFSQHFNLPVNEIEIPSDEEIKSYDELAVGLPKGNLTMLGLAQKLGREIVRTPLPTEPTARKAWADSERSKLKALIRYRAVTLQRPWGIANTKNKGVESKSYLFEMSNGLTANGVWFKAVHSPENAPLTIILDDKGKKSAGKEVADRINRGDQVLAVDLLFTGDAWKNIDSYGYQQMLHGTGDRALGLEVAQLIEIAQWMRNRAGVSRVRLESRGIRNQMATIIAAALQPDLFSELVIREGMPSLSYLLEKPVEYSQAAELFCLDLYKEFDVDLLEAMTGPLKILHEGTLPERTLLNSQ
ncbi:MAG: acetylxylan esterase [Terriglobia bacterium]